MSEEAKAETKSGRYLKQYLIIVDFPKMGVDFLKKGVAFLKIVVEFLKTGVDILKTGVDTLQAGHRVDNIDHWSIIDHFA